MNSDFLKSKVFKIVLVSIGGLIIALIIFRAGMMFGYRRALFSIRWGENYQRNFGRNFPMNHGTNGQIININPTEATFIVKGDDNVEKVILVKKETVINKMTSMIKITDLKNDEHVVIVGRPNESGQIEARLIRVFPTEIKAQ